MNGFTLIELMLVVIVLGVAAAAAVPNAARSIRAAELRGSAQNLASTVRLGQVRAMTQGRWTRVVLNRTGYWLEQDADEDEGLADASAKPRYIRLTGRSGRTQNFSDGIEMKGNPGEVVFSPEGRIAPCEFQVCRKDDCLTVAMGRELGQVEITAGDEEGSHAL